MAAKITLQVSIDATNYLCSATLKGERKKKLPTPNRNFRAGDLKESSLDITKIKIVQKLLIK